MQGASQCDAQVLTSRLRLTGIKIPYAEMKLTIYLTLYAPIPGEPKYDLFYE